MGPARALLLPVMTDSLVCSEVATNAPQVRSADGWVYFHLCWQSAVDPLSIRCWSAVDPLSIRCRSVRASFFWLWLCCSRYWLSGLVALVTGSIEAKKTAPTLLPGISLRGSSHVSAGCGVVFGCCRLFRWLGRWPGHRGSGRGHHLWDGTRSRFAATCHDR